jgi:hypothetical protein
MTAITAPSPLDLSVEDLAPGASSPEVGASIAALYEITYKDSASLEDVGPLPAVAARNLLRRRRERLIAAGEKHSYHAIAESLGCCRERVSGLFSLTPHALSLSGLVTDSDMKFICERLGLDWPVIFLCNLTSILPKNILKNQRRRKQMNAAVLSLGERGEDWKFLAGEAETYVTGSVWTPTNRPTSANSAWATYDKNWLDPLPLGNESWLEFFRRLLVAEFEQLLDQGLDLI